MDIDCVNNIDNVDTFHCFKPCTGLIITSLSELKQERDLERLFPIFGDYEKYKKLTKYPSEIKGSYF